MRRFRRILAATDFSEPGSRAVEAAFGLAHDGAATVHLLHVMERPHVPSPLYAHYAAESDWDPKSLEKAVAVATSALARLVPDEARQVGVGIDIRIVQGDSPHGEILRVARELDVEVIVMGMRGSALEHMLLGGVTERVMRKATCAVMCVH